MAFVAAAIGGSALLGAGSSIYGGILQREGAKEASGAQQDAYGRANQIIQSSSRDALSYLDPFRQFGLNAGSTLQDMLFSPQQRAGQIESQRMQLQGEVDRLKAAVPVWETYGQNLTGKNASERRGAMFNNEYAEANQRVKDAQQKLASFNQQAQAMQARADQQGGQQIQASPWYQFQADLFNRSQDRAMAARGLTGSGFEAEERRRGLIELGAGETERQFGRLKGLYDVGAQTSQVGANVLTGTGSQVAQNQVGMGQAQAQGILGAANANAGMVAGVSNAVTGAVGMGLQQAQWDKFLSGLNNRNNATAAPTGTATTP